MAGAAKSTKAISAQNSTLADVHKAAIRLHEIRDEPVLLDFELAALLQVETRILNQAVNRRLKKDKFPKDWAFLLSQSEFEDLRSQNVISSGHGGRRTPPLAFSEHGVVLAATLLNSDIAIQLTHEIVRVFIEARRGRVYNPQALSKTDLISPGKQVDHRGISTKIQDLLAVEINPVDGKTTRDEAGEIIAAGFTGIKAFLTSRGVSNKEIEAQILKHFAEMELILAQADTERQRSEKERLKNKAREDLLKAAKDKFDKDEDIDAFLSMLDKFLDKD